MSCAQSNYCSFYFQLAEFFYNASAGNNNPGAISDSNGVLSAALRREMSLSCMKCIEISINACNTHYVACLFL